MRERLLNYNTAIREAIEQSIKKNKKIILMGLGVDDPKGVFGTTLNLHKTFKNNKFENGGITLYFNAKILIPICKILISFYLLM